MTTATVTFDYSHTVGFLAYRGRGFIHPIDLTLSDGGVMHVLNRGGPEVTGRLELKRVCVCRADEGYIGEWGTGGAEAGQFWWPSAIARHDDGQIYVADEALQRINVFGPDGEFIRQWGEPGDGPGQINRPADIAVAPDGSLLISDGMNHRIQRFTRDGEYLQGWGSYGAQAGQFNTPWRLACDSAGNVFVADWRNDRVQAFTPEGRFVGQWGASGDGKGQLNRPSSVAVDDEGYIYVADWGNERVQIFDPDGEVTAILRGDATTSSWAEDYLAANPDESAARRTADLAPAVNPWRDHHRETSAGIEKFFWGPSAINLDAQGHIYVVDSCRHRVQIYHKNS